MVDFLTRSMSSTIARWAKPRLTIDLPHELRANFNCLFELLFGLAHGDCTGVPEANDARDAAISLREQSVELCGLYHARVTRTPLYA